MRRACALAVAGSLAAVLTASGFAPAHGQMVVVRTGHSGSAAWTLSASDTPDGHFCISFRSGHHTSMGCGSIHHPGIRVPFGLSFVAGSGSDGSYVYGPVVSTAETVSITLSNGSVITTRTIPAPKGLLPGIAFYFTAKPCQMWPQTIIGRDGSGREVARWEVARWSQPTSVAPNALHRFTC